jgi:uncharacterized protein (TIGR00251 family)
LLTERKDGVSIELRVKAGAKRDALLPDFRVEVRAPREKGRANAAVIALLAEHFGVPRSSVEILRGELDSHKVILLRGASLSLVRDRMPRE